MKQLSISILSIISLLLASTSCSVFDSNDNSLGIDILFPTDYHINLDVDTIDSEDAIYVADIFINSVNQTKSEKRQIGESFQILGLHGEPCMYVVNYKDNRGFVIVGASTNYAPILAYNEEGSFSKDYEKTGAAIWIDEQRELISFYSEEPQEKTLKFKALWSEYERGALPLTKGLLEVRRDFLQWAESNGYSYYPLYEQPNYLPNDTYSEFLRIAQERCNPDYDYMEQSIILGKVSSSFFGTGNLVPSIWGQQNGYNDAIKSANNDPLLGCTAVAVGQIMKYHQHPAYFDWNNMADYYATPAAAILLGNIRNRINWHISNNTSDPFSAKNALVEYGYPSSYVQSHNYSNVVYELWNSRPVLMSGASGISGHSWVCSGVNSNNHIYEFLLYTLAEFPPLRYELVDSFNGGEEIKYLYMNWGWEGTYNGWFYADNANPGSDNYNWARTEIVNITY